MTATNTTQIDAIDRLLVATALSEGLALLTHDENLCNYPVTTIW